MKRSPLIGGGEILHSRCEKIHAVIPDVIVLVGAAPGLVSGRVRAVGTAVSCNGTAQGDGSSNQSPGFRCSIATVLTLKSPNSRVPLFYFEMVRVIR